MRYALISEGKAEGTPLKTDVYKRQPLNEFRYNPDLKIGDTVEVYIENQEDKKGQLILSHKKARDDLDPIVRP